MDRLTLRDLKVVVGDESRVISPDSLSCTQGGHWLLARVEEVGEYLRVLVEEVGCLDLADLDVRHHVVGLEVAVVMSFAPDMIVVDKPVD